MKVLPTKTIITRHRKQVPPTISRRAFGEKEEDVKHLHNMLYELMEFQNLKATIGMDRIKNLLLTGQWMALLIFAQENSEEPIGYALFYPKWSSASGEQIMWLEDLYVKPPWRGHRVGKSLLANLASCCKELEYSAMDFLVLRENQNAMDFYEQAGCSRQSAWTLWRWPQEQMNAFLDIL